jgi:hypothetical protein
MKDMVSIRKMHPASLATSLGVRAEAELSGAAMALPSAEMGDDFVLGDNRLV